MIDYLEWILDAQERGEFGNELDGVEIAQTPFVLYTAKHTPEADIQKTDMPEVNCAEADARMPQEISPFEISAVSFTEKRFAQPQGTDRHALSDIDFLSEDERSFSLFFSDGHTMRNTSRSWVNGAYRESVLTAQAAASLQQGGGKALTVSMPDTAALAPSVSKLDEAFARDARRYDGGFSMY